MSNYKRSFIKMPYFLKLNEQKLKYLDVLTYVALKSFDNPNTECFPSYDTIAESAGLSRNFIIKSIARLKEAGYIGLWRKQGFRSPNKSYPNHYCFYKLDKGDCFFMIPHEVLKAERLTSYEKAMLLCLYQFNVAPTQLYGSIQEFADKLGLTKNTIDKKYLSLVNKGFLDNIKLVKRKITALVGIDWDFTMYLNLNAINEPTLKIA